jgi:coenzyme F420 hydrogenase subunit beta
MCPTSAISMHVNKDGKYTPKIQDDRCINCKICLRVCPGIGIKAHAMSAELFGDTQKDTRVQRLVGTYLCCYVSSATDSQIRQRASSGGAVTALLFHLLENGLIDGALVTKADPDNPIQTQSFIAHTLDDLLSATTSRYCPTTPNVVVKDILENPGRYAVVGLPCQIHGIRKAEEHNKILKQRIVLHLGLLCSGTATFHATHNYLAHTGIPTDTILNFRYRVGWPSNIVVELKNGATFIENPSVLLRARRFFLPNRCSLCFDQMNELADISFGDAWYERSGRSIIITRSKTADDLLQQAKTSLNSTKIDVANVINPSRDVLMFKKRAIIARMRLLRLFNKSVPSYDTSFYDPTFIDYGKSLIFFVNAFIGSKKKLWKFIPSMIRFENWLLQFM